MKKPTLLLFHGALGCTQSFKDILPVFQQHFTCYTLDFEGHGKRLEGTYSMRNFVENVHQFIQENQLSDVQIFAYSMGGYVALDYATKYKGISHIFTLGTKFDWSPEIAAKETRSLDANFLREKAPLFVDQLIQFHGEENWINVLQKTANFMTQLGENASLGNPLWSEISIPVTLIRASEDKMVSTIETEEVSKRIPHAKTHEIPGKHGLETVNSSLLLEILLNETK